MTSSLFPLTRGRSLQRDVLLFEESVDRQTSDSASDAAKLRLHDLRLCRLCFKNKFADGIGHVCVTCRRRVCAACGSLAIWRVDGKSKVSSAQSMNILFFFVMLFKDALNSCVMVCSG